MNKYVLIQTKIITREVTIHTFQSSTTKEDILVQLKESFNSNEYKEAYTFRLYTLDEFFNVYLASKI